MKLSARDQIEEGMVKTDQPGATAPVTIEVLPTVMITTSIPDQAAEELALTPGMRAFAMIKESDVMVASDHASADCRRAGTAACRPARSVVTLEVHGWNKHLPP